MSELESENGETKVKKWAREDLDRALIYFQSLDWCPKTGRYLTDMKALLPALRKVEQNITTVLDGFMKDKELRAFLVVHSVFSIYARSDGEFVESYMASRIWIKDEDVERALSKKLPEDLQKQFAVFEPELIPFDILSYRVEFGCRNDPETGRYNHEPIRIIDTTLDDVGKDEAFKTEEFLEKFEDIVL